MLRSSLSALLFVLLPSFAAAQTIALETDMSGQFEVPAAASTAKGHAICSFNAATSTLSVNVSFTGFTATVAHIHRGGAGVGAGPVVFGLTSTGPTGFSGSGVLAAADVTNLLHEGLYVNVHSGAFPGGEIRGQLRLARNYRSNPNGALETPPNPSLATGSGTLTLNQPAGTVSYNIQFTGLTPTAAHVHTGAPGVPGGVLFGLTQTGPNTYSGTSAALSNTALIDLAAGNLYVNIHTAAFPLGEIRDQVHAGHLYGDLDSMSVALGGTQTLHVAGGAANAGKLYFTFGSLSGTVPGIPVDAVVLPLNFDSYTNFTLSVPNSTILSGSLGFLGAGGVATTRFNLPPGVVAAGPTVNHATLVFDIPGTGVATIASQAVPCVLVP
ncbi:MAG: CHRD domain-containing protein [Planctomycetota bacterium]|nr:MAG: CHRD domain-containing protein [Planctomycetota bacterium]